MSLVIDVPFVSTRMYNREREEKKSEFNTLNTDLLTDKSFPTGTATAT